MAARFYLLPRFRLADPYSLDYWSYSPYHLATAECASAILNSSGTGIIPPTGCIFNIVEEVSDGTGIYGFNAEFV